MIQSRGLTGAFGTSLATHSLTNLTMGLILFGIAWALFDRYNRNEGALRAGARTAGARPAPRRTGLVQSVRLARLPPPLRRAVRAPDPRGDLRSVLLVVWSFAPIDNLENLGSFMMSAALVAMVVEAGLQMGRVLQQEVKAKTLASLYALPHSLGYIVWSKVLGCALDLYACDPVVRRRRRVRAGPVRGHDR